MTSTPELQEMRLADLAPSEWFSIPEDSSFWMRIYTCLYIPFAQFPDIVAEFGSLVSTRRLLALDPPVSVAAARLGSMKIPDGTTELYTRETGEILFHINITERELRDTTYILLLTPHRTDGVVAIEAEVRGRLDRAAAIIRLHTGRNFIRDVVFEGEVCIDGRLHSPGSPIKMPQPAEGPFLAQENGADIHEITIALSNCTRVRQQRVHLALEFLDSAVAKDNGFFEYWTALEILCDGKAPAIRTRLSALLGIKNHKDASAQLGFEQVVTWRHDYIHKGVRPELGADIERYLQLLFLDLLRQELQLPYKGHVVGLINAVGYDLTRLGLRDNRTETQKAAVAVAEAQLRNGNKDNA